MSAPPKHAPIVIIGAGVFGLSTALELSRRGYDNITVLDRHLPPVPGGSSVDISRIIRADYADEFYARMGLDALKGWSKEYSHFFYRSGLLCVQSEGSAKHEYLEQSKHNLARLGANFNIQTFKGTEATDRYPGIHGDLSHTSGYWNETCGWADAEGSISCLAKQCSLAGISFITGKGGAVVDLIVETSQEKRKAVGAKTQAGTSIYAETIILATGAWTPHLIDMGNRAISTAQPVGFIQLTPEEAHEMRDCPVMIDLSTGWFAFPPTPRNHVLKIARHGYGYETVTHPSRRQDTASVSAPTMALQLPFLPDDAERSLREGLGVFFPKLKNRQFSQRRLCWYSDTPKGDFIVDYNPEYSNIFLATGGSGQ